MGLLAVFGGPALISLLVCLLKYLMSPSLPLWFPPPLNKSVIIPAPKNNKPSCLNYYLPVALTSIVMKVFERLVNNHICSSIPVTLDPLQFANHPNRATDDAISHVLHSSLRHIDSKNGNYVRLHTFKFRLRKPGKDCTICDSWGNSGSHQQSWKRYIQGP